MADVALNASIEEDKEMAGELGGGEPPHPGQGMPPSAREPPSVVTPLPYIQPLPLRFLVAPSREAQRKPATIGPESGRARGQAAPEAAQVHDDGTEPKDPHPDTSRDPERLGLVKAFIKSTLQAFVQELAGIVADTAGLGPVYEVCSRVRKGTEAVDALAAGRGTKLSVPAPVSGVDLMVCLEGGDGVPGPSVSLFVAPGEGLAAAVEIATGGRGRLHPPAETPAADGPVKVCGEVAVRAVDLSALGHRAPADRVAVLRQLVEQNLRPVLCEDREILDVALVVGFDPAMRLAFWTRICPESSRVWRVVAEIDTDSGRLIIREIIPKATVTDESERSLHATPRIILRRT
jgi:hypothetical protein